MIPNIQEKYLLTKRNKYNVIKEYMKKVNIHGKKIKRKEGKLENKERVIFKELKLYLKN
jgi:hypothetical protein